MTRFDVDEAYMKELSEKATMRRTQARAATLDRDGRVCLQAIARALGLAVPPGEDAPTLVGRILNAAHRLRRDHDIMARRCAEYEASVENALSGALVAGSVKGKCAPVSAVTRCSIPGASTK